MERVLDKLGPWHIPVVLLALTSSIPYGFFVMSLSYMAPRMSYWCKPPPNINDSLWMKLNEGVDLRCEFWKDNSTQKCHEWEYDHTEHESTLLEQWNAVCDQDWMLATAQSTIMFGALIGCFVFSHLSDWYGRRTSYLASLFVIITCGFGISYTTNFWMFCFLRLVMATGHGGKRASSALYTESVGATHRAMVTVGQDFGWCLGLLIIPIITYHVRDWVLIQRIIILPEFIFVVLACLVDESPKWLLSAGKYDECRALLAKIVKRNGIDRDEDVDIDAIMEESKTSLMLEKRSRKGTLIDLVRGWTICKLSISCWGQYAVIILLYYHMMYFIVDIGSDPYMGVVYMALLEIPTTAASWWVVRTFRRKPVYLWSYLLAIFSGIALLFSTEDSVMMRMVLANLGKMASMFLFNGLLVHVSECFPTKVRSVALGTSAMASRVGAMAAPFLKQIGIATAPWVPICVTISLCIVALLLSLLLPETFGKKLPDTFYEAKQMTRQSSASKGKSLLPPS
ncbi:organic cation transporter protein [Galendromus occidentalis]|uniref:Organic cation transporter protein n=1 Tax=Galendromus occidentalis TaxID=34638 RepID=A0AAJ6QV97_9ACAR|nr:organic cation transporter protein [Galendromus occidentalis]